MPSVFLTCKDIPSHAIGSNRSVRIGRDHGVEDVKNAQRLRFDLKGFLHVLLDVIFQSLPFSFILFLIGPPLDKILCQFSLHIVHVQSRGTDGDSREVKVSNWLGCALQCGHYLCKDKVLNQLLNVESLFLAMKDG